MADQVFAPRAPFFGFTAASAAGAGVNATDRDGLGLATVALRKGHGAALAERVRERYDIELPHGTQRCEAHGIAFTGTAARAGVMASTRVSRDVCHHPPLVGDQTRAKFNVGRTLHAQRILRAVSLAEIFRTIEQGVDCLLALAIDDPQDLPFSEHARPRAF